MGQLQIEAHGTSTESALSVLVGYAAASGARTLIQQIQNFLVIAAGLAVVFGVIRFVVRFFDRRRLKVSVRGGPELVLDLEGQHREAFVFYVISERDHSIVVEACGIHGQDTVGNYWRLSLSLPGVGLVVVARGTPFRWVMPFGDIADFGLDPQRRLYAFARIAQPAKDVWSPRTTAGPQRGNFARSRPTPRARPAGQMPAPPPWWVRWFR
jgi:hypothetical protein